MGQNIEYLEEIINFLNISAGACKENPSNL